MLSKDECEFCEGAGYLLEDKDAYYYYSADLIRQANRETNKDRQREMIERVRGMKGQPMQPLAIECPKCHGTGRRTAGFNNGTERNYQMDELEKKMLATN